MTNWLYNKNGQVKLFLYDDRFISKNGKNLGWLVDGHVYGLRTGKHLGWYENGVLYDGNNNVLAFTKDSMGRLPYRPGLGGTPGRPGIPGRPGMPGLSGIPGRPAFGGWSNITISQFFNE